MLKNKPGFTLIELLAVVLIIATLTSVALPKYRRTIERAAATEALVNLRSIFAAAKRYKAGTSTAPTQLKGLDISLFDASSDESSTFTMGRFTYTFDNTNDRVSACRNDGNYCFHFYYKRTYTCTPEDGEDSITRTNEKDALFCEQTGAGKYDWMCGTLGACDLTPDATNDYEKEYTIE